LQPAVRQKLPPAAAKIAHLLVRSGLIIPKNV
jgi:hypothetical protein